ncbi:MAG: hypothetical protein PUF60_06600 [Firmicutes bacterium]|nr:hypothetical protein [Bacillota bacterium]
MVKEIGSEFWKKENIIDSNTIEGSEKTDIACLLSGRTALDFIIRDIKESHPFSKAMLPSYCCDSMIEPFIKNDIKPVFYSVDDKGIKYNSDNDCEVVLTIDYFGYENRNTKEIIKREKLSNKIIIYDSTHKINGNAVAESMSDYSFCSCRKWCYCNFAIAKKFTGKFNIDKPTKSNKRYLEIRNNASELKKQYMENQIIDKEYLLYLFKEAENILKHDYCGYRGEYQSIDINNIVTKRRRNATFLIEKLKTITRVKLLNDSLNENDSPLFVPIIVEKEYRDALQKYLIEKDIYCPIHWPVTNIHFLGNNEKKLFDKTLSLVCDQRYDLEDMSREIQAINCFFEEFG